MHDITWRRIYPKAVSFLFFLPILLSKNSVASCIGSGYQYLG